MPVLQKMDNVNVIIKPLVTEKSTHQQTTRNAYAFQVHPDANKQQIRDAVEKIYSVKVRDVRTMNRRGKPRRSRFKMTTTSAWKRAIVVLDENSRIELF
jgi:large subunit ribosomal protein L23